MQNCLQQIAMLRGSKRLLLAAAVAATGAWTCWAQTQATQQISLKSMPASVIKTVPVAGAKDVDPNLKEITVTFSKDMQDRSWSIPQTTPDENYPEGAGNIHYLPDKRTCVYPVKLQPGRTYVVWFNTPKFRNFRDTSGQSAVPYLLVFETKK